MYCMKAREGFAKQLTMRVRETELQRLNAVADNIAAASRGQRPNIVDIIRAILGWDNPDLVTPEEKAYIAFRTNALHGPFVASKAATSIPTDKRKLRVNDTVAQ
jgi:hypothetical protein